MSNLSVDFSGLKLKNPLIASAGPITTNIESVERLIDSGIAAIVTKTCFVKKEYEKWVGRKNIFPYKPVFKYQSLKNGRLLSLPTLSDIPVTEMAKRVEKMKKLNIPVIGSIMGLSPGGYRESAKILAESGADAIELDLCCTMPEFTTTYKYAGQNVNFYPKKYAHLIAAVKDSFSIPVGAKSTVSLYMYGKILEGLIRAKLKNSLPDFITLVGQLDQNPGVSIETLEPLIPHIPTFGWQGTLSGLTYSALATFSSALGSKTPTLSASGGIRDYEGVIQSMALGATTVQFQTVILDKGPKVISKILDKLNAHLESKGITSINNIIGIASRQYIPSLLLGRFMRERDTLFGIMHAVVSSKDCNGCGICESVCTESAVLMNGKKAEIIQSRCRACNLCVLKCPQEAISMENIEHLEQLIERYKQTESSKSFKTFMQKNRIGFLDKIMIYKNLKGWGFA